MASGVAVATGRTAVVGIDPVDGSELWSVPRKLGQLIPPALAPDAGPDGAVVYVEGSGPRDGGLVAIDLSSRTQLWRVRLGAIPRSAPSIEGGSVFFGSEDSFLYAVDLATGKVKWRAKLDGFVDTSPAVADGRVFALGENRTTGAATLYAFDAATGRRSWGPFAAPGFSIGVTSPTVGGDTLFVGFGDLQIRAFDVATGSLRWDSPVRSDFSPLTAPASSDGDVFVVDGTGGLYRFDGKTGELRWEFQFGSLFIWSSALVVENRVYAGRHDGTLAAVDAATGHRVWQRRLVGAPVGPLAPGGGRLMVPMLGRGGGMVALEDDPNGAVGDVPSPTTLRPVVALVNFAAGFIAVLAGALLLGFAVFSRGTSGGPSRGILRGLRSRRIDAS